MHQRLPAPRRPLGVLLILLVLALALPAARALARQADAQPPVTYREAHGWGIIPTGPNQKPTLVHLPPRTGAEPGGRSPGVGSGGSGAGGGVPRGTVRTAAWLAEAPEALASWDNRVYLVFPRYPATDPTALRRVMMASAERIVAGIWETQPPGRLRVLPALPGDAALAAFAASATGPAALLHRPGSSGESPWQLLALDGARWIDIPIPTECVRDLGPDPALVGDEAGLILITSTGPRAAMWEIRTLAPAALSGPEADVASLWRRHDLRWGDAPAGGTILAVGGRLMRLRADDAGRLAIDLIRPGPGGGVFHAATLDGVPSNAQPIPLDAAGELALLWLDPDVASSSTTPAPASGRPAAPLRLREVSALTGRTLYDGAATGPSLVASQQFRLLAVALILVMVTVLLFILRPEGRRPPPLPAGVTIAEPGRRIAAGMADLLLGLVAGAWMMDVPTNELLGPALFGATGAGDGGGRELAALGLALVVTWAHTTTAEYLFGRSIGKALAGCEVIRVPRPAPADTGVPLAAPRRAAAEPPTFAQAALRNLVRWALPPLAIWLFVDPAGRHPGDLLAGTAVVVRRDPEADSPE